MILQHSVFGQAHFFAENKLTIQFISPCRYSSKVFPQWNYIAAIASLLSVVLPVVCKKNIDKYINIYSVLRAAAIMPNLTE